MPPSREAQDAPCRELAVRTLAATRGGDACLHHDGTCGILAGAMKATRHRRASRFTLAKCRVPPLPLR